ncbi:YheC/YheD family endospore coat-associated protein [Paenibacillus agricola]|nr:YheC/YheD family protein [Paenibacillus agricola]
MVGILLDNKTYAGITRKRSDYEHIGLYNKATNQLGLKPLYMSLNHTGKRIASGYTYSAGRFQKVRHKIPKVIHNRAMTLTSQGKKRLEQLAKTSTIFNRTNRFDKYRIYRLLYRNPSLRTYLPKTVHYSKSNLVKAMGAYSGLFIKPSSGSVGDGIIKISKISKGNWYIFQKKGKPTKNTFRQTVKFIERYVGTRIYHIQETIQLSTYKGRPYDLRVSVQRGRTGTWQVTGIVGKVAAVGRHVTNVAKGGKVRRYEELFQSGGLPVETVKNEVHRVSLEIANYLGKHLPHLADIGLDMGVDPDGAIKFIEMNGRDQRISFKKAGMHATFYKTYLNPLQYASSLMKPKKSLRPRPNS